MKTFRLDSIEAIKDLAPNFIQALKEGRHIAFYGKMGAGKTTFITGLMEFMGVEDHVSSPTFSIVNEYYSAQFGKIYHFDFYRIESEEEALDIGIEEIFDEGAWCFMEWPEKIDNLLPENYVRVDITTEQDVRLINVDL
jgi:tRNA threonylcarbamoyladenosine biosynthesis protein TsaE